MFKKIIFIFLLFWIGTTYSSPAYAADEPVYTQLKSVDVGTFNEFRYKITDEFFVLRNKYEINQSIDSASAKRILDLAQKGYNYLPDSLSNKNYYNYLKTSIERGLLYPNNDANYTAILTAIDNYLEKTNIQSIKWSVEAFPKTWNAPLLVTLRWNVVDPTWTQIPAYNYTWWIYENWAKKILGDNISMTHLFKEEWTFAVFLDVSSSHKNEKGYIDVLPFSSRAEVTVKEKIASVIIKVNWNTLLSDNELKFTPDEARYWLLFDATSSSATSGAEFIETIWDFWNGVTREYTWDPRVERVVYAKEWDFTVSLKLKTNELKQIERKFNINIHDPISTINSSQEEGFLWDKFTFSAQTTWNDKNLSYAWEIIDLNKDEVILRKSWTLFTYSFAEKGKYNIKMIVTDPSWESDVDSKIIYINSRAPSADFTSTIPLINKPNRVFLDATKSFDPDFSDDGKLKYSWIIDWNRVELEEPNFNGSTWYFVFDSVWDHSVVLVAEDPDGISSQKKDKVTIKSILSVDFFAFPRVTQRLNNIKFVSESPEAKFYEWDFWDGDTKWWSNSEITHSYDRSGIFNVKLKVRDANDKENTFTKNVYIWDSDAPYSFVSVRDTSKNDIIYDNSACGWEWAYVVNRVDTITFSWGESINITGKNDGLTYSWKLWKDSYKNSKEFTKKFDELGCFPIKLTVKSNDNWKTHSTLVNVDVRNLKPILSSIDIRVVNDQTDPVIVNVDALWAQDRDWVIQSYLWYYYTDVDSEPQDFRSTKFPTTSFVLPKITWNYYFVVVMKDNNEDLITSEEITGSKYFMALTWDNLNTPLVKLTVDDSSVAIWDEVTFTSNVENILGQDLSKKVKYSWDFDWDGFYDKESSSNTETYKYLTSGEKHIKVKAKYKWFSNTKSITINVSNVLKPDFWYISVWSKFIFFDESIWTSDTTVWDLWDGTIINNQKYVIHTYTDSKVSHQVKLKISEWTKVKDIEKKVVKNVKNIILAKKEWLVLFSNLPIVEDEIAIEEDGSEVFIYLWESKPGITNYVIDNDIEYDSDLNGSSDDDEDNSKLDSYTSWGPIKINLNQNKFQKIRAFVKNSSWEVVDSKDIIITKNYIKEEIVDINNIVFEGVSESIKLKIEKLKEFVSNLPKEHKLKALMYVQKLKDEWSDNREKTNVILELEWFIYDTWVENTEEIINLLESLLVDNQKDQSEKAITFNALKNLLPTTIVCTDVVEWTQKQCYEEMVSKLEAIRDNENIDQNKILWVEILDVVAVDTVMTTKQKTDFKAILKTLVYGWVENIPTVDKEEIIANDTWSSSNFMSLLFGIIKWVFYIVLWFVWIVWGYYIYYLVVNKDKNIWFQDFIIEKTSWVKHIKNKEDTWIEAEIFEELNNKPEKIEEEKEEEIKEEEVEEKKVEQREESWTKEQVPDWLKWSFSEEEKVETKKPEKIEEVTEEEITEEEVEEEKVEQKEEIISDEQIEEETKIEKENIPDWLRWSFTEEKPSETKKESIEKPKEPTPKKSDDNIPDWLKWSFTEEKKEETPKKEVPKKEEISKEEPVVKKEEKEIKEEKVEEKKEKPVQKPKVDKETKAKTEKKKEEKKVEEKKEEKKATEKTQDKKPNTNTELWDDWMNVPDWLKTDDEK